MLSSILGSRFWSSAEPNEHSSMVLNISIGHVGTKDVSQLVLIGASDMRVVRVVFELDAFELRTPHDALLLIDWKCFHSDVLCFHF
jgi:hypothetical protein